MRGVICAGLCRTPGQGTGPNAKTEDYPAHVSVEGLGIGAEYTIHSFNGEGGMFVAPDYLVIEVALYPKEGEELDANEGQFSLRLNGKKHALMPQAPPMVAASLKYSDWDCVPASRRARAWGMPM